MAMFRAAMAISVGPIRPARGTRARCPYLDLIGEQISSLSVASSIGGAAMPAKSAAQQKAAGAALSVKRGNTPKSKLKGASTSMMSMSETELKKMASTKRKGKPEHKSKSN
jgi:Protein of unknwon function (DUF3008)